MHTEPYSVGNMETSSGNYLSYPALSLGVMPSLSPSPVLSQAQQINPLVSPEDTDLHDELTRQAGPTRSNQQRMWPFKSLSPRECVCECECECVGVCVCVWCVCVC